MDSLFLALGLLTVAIFAYPAYKKRHNASKCIASITLGVLFATFLLVLPTEWVKEGKTATSEVLYSILSSLLYSFKALSGRQDIAQLETIGLSGLLRGTYIGVCYVMFTLAPILASGLVLSFIGDTGDRIRYRLSRSPRCYVFAELNENGLALARGIHTTEGKKTLVFCGTEEAGKDLLAKARELGAIALHTSCNRLKLLRNYKAYEICLLSENEDQNIAWTKDFVLRKEELQAYDITINSFSQSGADMQVIESMMAKAPCAVFESTHELLVRQAITVHNEAPKTKIVFFGADGQDPALKELSEKHEDLLAFSSDWKSAEVDEVFKTYAIDLYTVAQKVNDQGKIESTVSKQGLGYCDRRLVTCWQEELLKIRFIDEVALYCNHLLFQHPLYRMPSGRRDPFVLLVGCGRMGMQMLKTVAWCGQMEGHSLRIRVLDKDAGAAAQRFYAACPEMRLRHEHSKKPIYDIEFVQMDAESEALEQIAAQYGETTFVCVATGSDDLNVTVAERLYRVFRRQYDGDTPPIFARVRKGVKSGNFAEKASYLKDRRIELFGTAERMYSNETLFNTQLENLAFAVHLCYNWALKEPQDSFAYQKALYDFYTSEYDRRSSMAAALHIGAKLHSCGIDVVGTLPTEEELGRFVLKIQDEECLQALMKNEHERWNAYMRSEGFCGVDFDTVCRYAPQTRSHKDERAKLHPCIVEWEALDSLQEKYNKLQSELQLKKSNFKEYDQKIVEEIPDIVRKAMQPCEEET